MTIAPVINTCYKQFVITSLSLSLSLSLVNCNSTLLVTRELWKTVSACGKRAEVAA